MLVLLASAGLGFNVSVASLSGILFNVDQQV